MAMQVVLVQREDIVALTTLDTVGGQVSDTTMLMMEVTLSAAFVIVNNCTVCANGGVKQRGRGGRVHGRGGGGKGGDYNVVRYICHQAGEMRFKVGSGTFLMLIFCHIFIIACS